MNGKKLYIIYAAELLLYLLFHFIQIQKGLFGQVFFYRNPGSSFSMGGCLSVAFSGKKDPKKGGVEAVGNPFFCFFKVHIPYGWDMSF